MKSGAKLNIWSLALTNLITLLFMVFVTSGPVSAQDAADADALAKELANPGGALSSLNNKLEIRWFDGDLTDADKQHAYTYIFQPTLPFPTDGGDIVIFRPAFAYLMHQPYFDASFPGFDQSSAFGDIGIDLLYSFGGLAPYTFGVGVVGAVPTGTDEKITGENWLLGPEMMVAETFDWGLAGIFAFHQWKVAGHGDDFNKTSLQPLFTYSLGNGVTVGSSGTITYNWNADHDGAWTVPVGLNISKTTSLNGKPIKYSLAAEYNVVRPDTFGPEWKVTFSIAPIIQNPFLK